MKTKQKEIERALHEAEFAKNNAVAISLAVLMVGGALIESEGTFFLSNLGDKKIASGASILNATIYCKEMRNKVMKNFPDFADTNYDRAGVFRDLLKQVSVYDDATLQRFQEHLKEFRP